MKVLIVEDAAIVAERIELMLSDPPLVIKVVGRAVDATGALEAIDRLRPDVVTLDLSLTQGTGFDVLKRVKKEPGGPVILVLTNHDYPQIRTACLEAGADFFLDKSTEFDKLPAILMQLAKDRQ